jgi:hypothetical protein
MAGEIVSQSLAHTSNLRNFLGGEPFSITPNPIGGIYPKGVNSVGGLNSLGEMYPGGVHPLGKVNPGGINPLGGSSPGGVDSTALSHLSISNQKVSNNSQTERAFGHIFPSSFPSSSYKEHSLSKEPSSTIFSPYLASKSKQTLNTLNNSQNSDRNDSNNNNNNMNNNYNPPIVTREEQLENENIQLKMEIKLLQQTMNTQCP